MTRIARRVVPGLAPGSLTEAEWQRQVHELLDLYGWDYRYHVMRAKMSPWGWPDVVAVRRRDRRLLFAELKTDSGQATPDQLGLLELLLDVAGGGAVAAIAASATGSRLVAPPGTARVDVELWRPSDVDRVMEVLK